MIPIVVLAWGLLLCLLIPVQAEIYKWVDQAGRIHFSDTLREVPAGSYHRLEEQTGATPGRQHQPEIQRAGLARRAATPPAAPPSYSVPVQRDGQAMLVDAIIGGSVRARLLVDTGAEFTVLSSATARRAGLDLAQTAVIPLRSASGVFLAPLTKLRLLSLGEAVVYDMEVIVHDTSPELDGLLGMSFLDNFSFTISAGEAARLILTPVTGQAEAGLYGGHSQDWWQRKFRFYRRQIESSRSYLGLYASPELERTIRYLQTALETLERQALLAGVPRRWRD